MAIVEDVATRTIFNSTLSVTKHNPAHTVPSGTTLLLCWVHLEGNEDVDTPLPRWNIIGDPEPMTLIHAQSSTGSASDTRSFVYGLVNPTPLDNKLLQIDFVSSVNPSCSIFQNFSGTETGSVEAATGSLISNQNTSASTITGFGAAGAGTLGRFGVASGVAQGADMNPVTWTSNDGADDRHVEIWDDKTGTSNTADFAHTGAEATLPTEGTVTLVIEWAGNDENGGILIELIPIATEEKIIRPQNTLLRM